MRSAIALFALLLATPASAEEVWVLEDVQSERFADTDMPPGPMFDKGDKLIVLFRDDGRIRVRKANRYGWIDAEAVTNVDPDALGAGKAKGKAKGKGKKGKR